jgi:hypothetical protein
VLFLNPQVNDILAKYQYGIRKSPPAKCPEISNLQTGPLKHVNKENI